MKVLLDDGDGAKNKLQHDKEFCKMRHIGIYAAPGDCRAYYACTGKHRAFYREVATGNVFDHVDKKEKLSWKSSSCTIKKVFREVWKSSEGRDVDQLVYNGRFPCEADESGFLDTLCFYKYDFTDKYGQRMRAFFKAPESGAYTFGTSCDDSCQVWLSTDRNPDNKRLIHNQKKPTSRYTWQSGEPITLQENKVYYMEVLQKEFVGKDFACVSVTLPSENNVANRPISATYLVMGSEERELLGCRGGNGTEYPICAQQNCVIRKVKEFAIRMDGVIEKLISIQGAKSSQKLKNITEECVEMIHTMLQDPEKKMWRTLSYSQAMQIALKTEQFGHSLASALNNETVSVEAKRGNIVMHARALKGNYDSRVSRFPSSENTWSEEYVEITAKEKKGKSNLVAFSVIYRNLDEFLPQNVSAIISNNRSMNSSYELNSHIVGGLVTTMDVVKEVIVFFKHLKNGGPKSATSVCVWWDFSASNNKGMWSSVGCELLKSSETHSTCICNHLTNFAVLMQVNPSVKVQAVHETALEIITYIGCTLSLLGVLFTVITISCLLGLRSERNLIHLNLSLSIGIFQVVFLAGIEATSNKVACAVVAVFLHYFSLVVFAWMLVEGIYLYVMIITVFENIKEQFKFYMISAYGIPAVVVAISLGIAHEGYGTKTSCWLSVENGVIYGFVSPAILIILINAVILAMVIKEIVKIQTNGVLKSTKVDLVRSGLKSSVVLLPLLGITWSFGLLALSDELVAFQYMFAIFNSLQGFFIFIFHCVMNSEIRKAIQRKKEIWDSRRSNFYPSSSAASTAPAKRHALDKTTEYSSEARIISTSETDNKGEKTSNNETKPSKLSSDANCKGSVDQQIAWSDVSNRKNASSTNKHAVRLPPVYPLEKKGRRVTSTTSRKDQNETKSSSVSPVLKTATEKNIPNVAIVGLRN